MNGLNLDNAVVGNNTNKEVLEGHSLEIMCPSRGQESILSCNFTLPSNETKSKLNCIYRIDAVKMEDSGVYRLVSVSTDKSLISRGNTS